MEIRLLTQPLSLADVRDKPGTERVEFDSLINVRPSQGNRSRGVDDERIRARILAAVAKLVKG